MSERIHELLLRNLLEVFGEGDPAKRRSAIEELYTDDCVVYVPSDRLLIEVHPRVSSSGTMHSINLQVT